MQDGALTPFDTAAVLVVAAAALGYVNHRWIGLPHTVGLTVTGLVASLAVIGLDAFARLIHDHRFESTPMILETPLGDDDQGHARDLAVLRSL